jgi:hypothetical protein
MHSFARECFEGLLVTPELSALLSLLSFDVALPERTFRLVSDCAGDPGACALSPLFLFQTDRDQLNVTATASTGSLRRGGDNAFS